VVKTENQMHNSDNRSTLRNQDEMYESLEVITDILISYLRVLHEICISFQLVVNRYITQ